MEKEKLPKKLSPIKSSPSKIIQKSQEKKRENKIIKSPRNNNQNQNQIKNSQQMMKAKQSKFTVDQYDQKAIFLCQFCGGESCPQQNYLVNKIQPNAIQGLHSNWITNEILATQRPSDRLIKQFNLIKAFKQNNLNTILNLQQPGQHPYCGDGIDLYNGFSYNPQTFFQNGIRFENQCWQDMTATTFQHMMKIMNIFHRSINQNKGKIAVHCHAGRGRTLLVICSWLIFQNGMPAQKTIELAIQKRQGVLTRTSQRQFLKQFENQLHLRRKVFQHIEHKAFFSEFIQWQSVCRLNHQKKTARSRPFVHYKILNVLRSRMQKQSQSILKAFIHLSSTQKAWTKKQEERLTILKRQFDLGRSTFENNQDVRILVALLQDFYDHLPFTVLSLHSVQLLKNQLIHQEQLSKNQSMRAVTKIINIHQNILNKDISKDVNQLAIQSKLVPEGESSKQNFYQNSNGSSFGVEGFFKSNKNKNSDLAWFPLHLKVLYEPSIVHQIGVPGISTFLDFALLIKQLLSYCKQKISQKEVGTLFIKISLILQSKKQFFPKIFRGDHLRQSKLLEKIDKIQKYTNKNIIYIAEYLRQFYEKLPSDPEFMQKMILKLKKVQGNIEYYKLQHKNTKRFHDIDKLKKIYDDARVQ